MSASWQWRNGHGGGPGEFRPGLDQQFDGDSLVALRSAVAAHGGSLGLTARLDDLVLVAHELATNAVRHGGGKGRLRMWRSGDSVFCEVTDSGGGFNYVQPLAGRRPSLGASGGRGLWIVAQLVDEMAVDSGAGGTTALVELQVRTAPAGTGPDGGSGSG